MVMAAQSEVAASSDVDPSKSALTPEEVDAQALAHEQGLGHRLAVHHQSTSLHRFSVSARESWSVMAPGYHPL
jgi:hypothetical protein